MKTTPTLLLGVLTLAVGACFSFAAQAQAPAPSLSKADYKAEKEKIAATYKTERAACDKDKGNAKDICIAQAKGKEKIDKANLEERHEPSEKHRYNALMAKADADFDIAKERCDDQSGDARNNCRKEAKAAHTAAKAQAKAQAKAPKK